MVVGDEVAALVDDDARAQPGLLRRARADAAAEPVDPPGPTVTRATATGTLTSETLDAGGLTRDYLLYVPSGLQPGERLPLLLVFHGNGDTAQNFYGFLQLGEWAQGSKFVVAVFDGPRRSIQGHQLSWDAYSIASDNADIALVNAALAQSNASTLIDPDRVYLLGHSQGGFFAFRVAMEFANDFAAVAMQASANPMGASLIQSAPRKIPVWLTIGTNDGLVGAARQTESALRAAGHDVDYTELPGVGHGGWKTSETARALEFLLSRSR